MERRSLTRTPGVLAIAVIATLTSFAVPTRLRSQQSALFRGHVDLVNVGVTVADKKRQLVTNLDASDFAVSEDGRLQTIFAFAQGEHAGPPLHVGVLLDVSGSQENDLPFTQTAAIKFQTMLDDAVDMTFIDFADDVRASRFARSDLAQLNQRVRELRARGGTALPPWMGTLTVDGIPGRWGRSRVIAKGDDKAMLSTKQVYERILAAREELGKKELIA